MEKSGESDLCLGKGVGDGGITWNVYSVDH